MAETGSKRVDSRRLFQQRVPGIIRSEIDKGGKYLEFGLRGEGL